ncbi:hypothetical protein BJX61DRAFT_517605 [Aspergillus egyptiacus]|nr:hypothetical protein BJX61DRAFT_517605 [Aspergillus egyptiacus]
MQTCLLPSCTPKPAARNISSGARSRDLFRYTCGRFLYGVHLPSRGLSRYPRSGPLDPVAHTFLSLTKNVSSGTSCPI